MTGEVPKKLDNPTNDPTFQSGDASYSHDAFGMIGMSITSVGGGDTLFGSDLTHPQQIRLCIRRARLDRRLSGDYFHSEDLVAEVSMSHSQFAEMITSPNRGDGLPCTIKYAAARGTPIKKMPEIIPEKSKAEILRNEVRASAKMEMEKIEKAYAQVESIISSGGSKKDLKAALFTLKCHIENTSGNMEFVVKQAEKTLEKAVSSAKIDVESYVNTAIHRLGLDAAKAIGLNAGVTQAFLTDESRTVDLP